MKQKESEPSHGDQLCDTERTHTTEEPAQIGTIVVDIEKGNLKKGDRKGYILQDYLKLVHYKFYMFC